MHLVDIVKRTSLANTCKGNFLDESFLCLLPFPKNEMDEFFFCNTLPGMLSLFAASNCSHLGTLTGDIADVESSSNVFVSPIKLL